MKLKKKIGKSVLALSILASSGVLGSPTALAAPVHAEQIYDVQNFDRDSKKATEWAKQQFKLFDTSLSKYQRNLLGYYTYDGWYINQYLRDGNPFEKDEQLDKLFYDRDLNDFNYCIRYGHQKDTRKNARYYKDFDQLFQTEGAKLSNSIVLHRRVDEKEFMEELTLSAFINGRYAKDINKKAFNKFKETFEYKKINNVGYMSSSISKDHHSQFIDRPIAIELSVPKGTPVIYISNCYGEIVLPRNSSYQIDEISLFKEDKDNLARMEGVKVKAHLVIN
ncbi:ADP-ribosyltransferase [Bacillus thuringiensis]|uniref:ADP-ribosyltransferase n=1 Tax=Bacillus thuringiensis TaxID=1428 RepID=UPI003459B4CA